MHLTSLQQNDYHRVLVEFSPSIISLPKAPRKVLGSQPTCQQVFHIVRLLYQHLATAGGSNADCGSLQIPPLIWVILKRGKQRHLAFNMVSPSPICKPLPELKPAAEAAPF